MKRYQIIIIFILGFFFQSQSYGQALEVSSSGKIYNKIEKLGVLANILFVAAHPDDENTRMISYLANDLKADTKYLSLTRGDGGQNLIGPEIKELLGVIRTQELLAARRVDGGSQMFSRANDFGYSKNAEETIKIWDDKKVLSDVVWAIRTFKPDVIINRFDHRTSGNTHGHHSASAMLSYDAYDLASDKTSFPEQLEYTETWDPQRLYFNTSWWFYGSREKFAKADKSRLLGIDVGTFYPQLGISNNEMAAESRSKHVCQGMGSTPQRGGQIEYLELLKGNMPTDKTSIMDGIETSWKRVEGSEKVERQLALTLANYDFRDPSNAVPNLMELRKLMKALPDGYWKNKKLEELDIIISDAVGIYIETTAEGNLFTPGQEIVLNTEIVSRLSDQVELTKVDFHLIQTDTTLNNSLTINEVLVFENTGLIPLGTVTTSPYYLREKGTLGMYKVDDQSSIGRPESDRPLKATYHLTIAGEKFQYTKSINNKYTDPERGEVHRPVEIVEPFYVEVKNQVVVFSDNEPKEIEVIAKGMIPNTSGIIDLNLPKGWKSTPATASIKIIQRGEEKAVRFMVTPPDQQESITIRPSIKSDGNLYNNTLYNIDYHHIPEQHVALPSSSKLVKINIKTYDQKILYVEGAGDEIPASLRQINYDVTVIDPSEISSTLLSEYDVVIMGIRAYNKSEELKFKQELLLDFVKKGGNMIVQYNTNRRLKVDQIAPFPIRLSRDRVSVEEAKVIILDKTHPVVTTPNKITDADFQDWVQERGLYFADEWDEKYTPIFSSNDPGEEAKIGGMLIAPYGKGHFVYSGYSWFRELPAGVPGAYRIFANMISLGKS